MNSCVEQIKTESFAQFCLPLDNDALLITGNGFISIFSLISGEMSHSFSTPLWTYHALLSNDKRRLFATSYGGLLELSFPELELVAVHGPRTTCSRLVLSGPLNTIFFSSDDKIFGLDLETLSASPFVDGHDEWINSLALGPEESVVFSTGDDSKLMKWDASSRELIGSADLDSPGSSMIFQPKHDRLIVGLSDGSLAEFRADDLSLIGRTKIHSDLISEMRQFSQEVLITSSFDGLVKFFPPQLESIPVSASNIEHFAAIDPKRLACACGQEGVRIIELSKPIEDPSSSPQSETSKKEADLQISDDEESRCDLVIDQLIEELQKIRTSKENRKGGYLSLVQSAFSDLQKSKFDAVEDSTSDSIPIGLCTFLDKGKSHIRRSYYQQGKPSGKEKLIFRDFSVERIVSSFGENGQKALISLFEQRIRLLGRLSQGSKEALGDLQVEAIHRNSLSWVFDRAQRFESQSVSGPASASLANGTLRGFIANGVLAKKEGVPSLLQFEGETFEVLSMGESGEIRGEGGRSWRIDCGRILRV